MVVLSAAIQRLTDRHDLQCGLWIMGVQPVIFVCIKCTGHAKGCTLITEVGDRLPLVCVDEITRKAISCDWLEVPERELKKIIIV